MQYRGYTITKHDTGGRRIGRTVTYRITDPTTNETIATAFLLKQAKAIVDFRLDATPEQIAHRDKLITELIR